ncbi:hypothetical protein ACJMK2_021281 [Sinanodonta woodiana]|uniref:Chaoptin n=1 Tax=Sinanodonta woodiana TaxID=1069815 RepID=A0ABD3THK5_SINWO
MRNNSFTGLQHFWKLDLSNNYIDLLDKSNLGLLQRALRPGIFRGLINLKSLNLQNNNHQFIVNATRLPDTTFSDLVGLENLHIDGAPSYVFGPGFGNLTNFKSLIISGWDGYCELERLESQTFMYVSYLQNIDIIHCKPNYIDPGAFRPLKNLQTLNLSENTDLGFQNFRRLLDIYLYRVGSKLSLNNIHDLFNTQLKEVNMTHAIEIGYGVLSNFPSTLPKLYLQQNRLSVDIQGKSFPSFENSVSLGMVLMETRNEENVTRYKISEYYKTNKTISRTVSSWKVLKHRRFKINSVKRTRHFETLSTQIHYRNTMGSNHSILVDLGGNKLFYTCKTLPFLHWLKETKVVPVNKEHYYCRLENDFVQPLNDTEFLERLEESCKSYLMVYIVTTIAVTFIIASIYYSCI